MTEFFE